jgi:AAA15 family ATPase/GTPase
MLIKFAVTNFRGFEKRIEWDLSKHNNYEFNTYAIRNGIVKNGIIYGPNGSGKTNFGLAIFDIEYHISQKWKKQDYFNNYVFAGNSSGLVDFEYTFKFNKQIIEYSYSKNSNGNLVRECLKVDNSLIFQIDENYFVLKENTFPLEESFKKNFKNSANNVSFVRFLLSTYPLNSEHYLIKLRDFVDSMLWFHNTDIREFIGFENGTTDNLDEYIISNNLLSDFADFLRNVSNQEFEFVADQLGKHILCKINDSLVFFISIASTGTRALELLYFWIKRISKDASFVFIDEFDAFYHFKLSLEVCKRLFKLDCQVFMSSHNTFLTTNELLRPDCNFILNNNKIKSLSECTDKELRFGHNIEKLFRGDTFAV